VLQCNSVAVFHELEARLGVWTTRGLVIRYELPYEAAALS
jgi:hypothetical protein